MGQWVGALFTQRFGSVCQKWSLSSLTDQKNTVEMQEDVLRKFVAVFVTYRRKWLTENSR